MTQHRWTHRPPGSNWGDFGPDDELGRINLLTPERVRRAVSEVREGKTFCLSLPLDYPGGNILNPRRTPPQLRPTQRNGADNFNFPLNRLDPRHTDILCDDAVLMCLQYSTQWDSFAHVGQHFDADGDGTPEKVYYNGFRAAEDILAPGDGPSAGTAGLHLGAQRLGIDTMAAGCVQGRGVMIDLFAHYGNERKLVGYDDLMRIIEADAVTVETGDMVCFRTGFDQLILAMKRQPDLARLNTSCATLDGRDARLLQWVTDSGAAVLISDNYGVEEVPARGGHGEHFPALPLHEHCLFKIGVHLGELFHLSELADWLRANGRSRFLLTAPPLRLPGAVGSPVTPIATV
jgi:kynurenine formamidase